MKSDYVTSTTVQQFKKDMATNPLGTRAGIKRLGRPNGCTFPIYIVEHYSDSIAGPRVSIYRPRFKGESHFRDWVHIRDVTADMVGVMDLQQWYHDVTADDIAEFPDTDNPLRAGVLSDD